MQIIRAIFDLQYAIKKNIEFLNYLLTYIWNIEYNLSLAKFISNLYYKFISNLYYKFILNFHYNFFIDDDVIIIQDYSLKVNAKF